MKGKEIKVVATKTYKLLEELFKEGDEFIIQTVLYDEDTVIVNECYQRDKSGYYVTDENNKPIIMFNKVVAPKGTFKSLNFIIKGETYPSSTIDGVIGNIPIDQYLKKT